jgi:hypothetical protein
MKDGDEIWRWKMEMGMGDGEGRRGWKVKVFDK